MISFCGVPQGLDIFLFWRDFWPILYLFFFFLLNSDSVLHQICERYQVENYCNNLWDIIEHGSIMSFIYNA